MTAPSTREGWLHARAIFAVAALYALLVQALLGALAAAPFAAPSGQICLSSASPLGEPVSRGEAPAEHASHDGCCLAACAGGPALPPAPVTLARPARRVDEPGRRDAGRRDERVVHLGTCRARAPPVI